MEEEVHLLILNLAYLDTKDLFLALVCGLSFQFPVMKGFRANNSVLVDRKAWLLTKAFVVPTRDKRERVEENFIVKGVGWYNTSQFFLSLCWIKREIDRT